MMPGRQITLRDVRAALDANPTLLHNKLFYDLVNDRVNSPLKCTHRTAERFGGVMVTLHKQSLFRAIIRWLSTPTQVRDVLMQELVTVKQKYGLESISWHLLDRTNTFNDEKAAITLINRLIDPTFMSPEYILRLPSPYLDSIGAFPEDTTGPLVISRTELETSILPRGTLIHLQHQNEATTSCTLLTGSILWMIWPPTRDNLTVLQNEYDAYSVAHGAATGDIDNVAKRLIGGVTFVQAVGEVTRIPPFCIIIGQVMEMSALCKYSVFEADRVVPTLRMLPFLRSWWAMEGVGLERQTLFGSALVGAAQMILNGTIENLELKQFTVLGPERRKALLSGLLDAWDEVKDWFVAILRAERAKELKEMMIQFLEKVGGAAPKCAICRMSITEGVTLDDHFEKAHWPKTAATRVKRLKLIMRPKDD